MKPTQQEIIELAREHATRYTNRHYPDKPVFTFTQDALQKVIELALERFGAGGGEPVLFSHPDIFAMKAAHVGVSKPGHELPGYIPLYTHASPTDLRAEYIRGLEDAKKACESWANQHSSASGGCTHVDCDFMAAALDCAEAIEALKGKQ